MNIFAIIAIIYFVKCQPHSPHNTIYNTAIKKKCIKGQYLSILRYSNITCSFFVVRSMILACYVPMLHNSCCKSVSYSILHCIYKIYM